MDDLSGEVYLGVFQANSQIRPSLAIVRLSASSERSHTPVYFLLHRQPGCSFTLCTKDLSSPRAEFQGLAYIWSLTTMVPFKYAVLGLFAAATVT